MPRIKFYLPFFILLVSLNAAAQSGKNQPKPTPIPIIEDDSEKIFTEEIKLNVLAFDADGKFNPDLKKEDLVINENDVLHQAASVRRVPANVLIVMDTGGEMRQMKSLQQTRETAKEIVNALKDGDSAALIEYSDKAEIVAEWTTDKNQLLQAIVKKTKFGRRDDFVGALNLARNFLEKNPLDNRHLVLITDGTDTISAPEAKAAAMRKLLATDINVHVISYTKMETTDIEPRTKGISNTPPPRAMPPEVAAQLPNGVRDTITAPKIGPTINLDRAMLKQLRAPQRRFDKQRKSVVAARRKHERRIYSARNQTGNARQSPADRADD